ncbi:MAG: T9SS type A sorting domain-containing protein [Candidatus Sabulitectum sp.]|nr:T9SS type A sorting domain-containing protein [Candidatus Sabulitectum sp.]
MKLMSTVLFCLVTAASSDTAHQTDWSGGPGEPGPVTEWMDSFSSSDEVVFAENPGFLSLFEGILTDAGTEIEASAMYSICAYAEDVDMDGDADIIAASFIDNKILWWENLNEGISWQSHAVASNLAGAFGAVCADVDNDGDNDILGTAMGAKKVIWWENLDGTGTSWDEHIIDDSLDGAKGIATVDMDEDGMIDVVASAKSDDMVVWYRNNGSGGSWTKHIVVSDFDCAMSVDPIDFDNDGDLDILSAAKLEGAVRWFENTDGSGTTWIEHSVDEDLYYARGAHAGDIDGDGDVDVLCAGGISKSSGMVRWWENTDGTATNWTQHVIDPEFHGPFSVLQFDVDQDGDLDAVSGSLAENVICWWENKNSGTSWEKHTLCNYYAPGIISAADLTGDGVVELFAGSLYSFNITWWKTYGYQPEGSLISSILDTGEDSQWNTLEWTADVPGTTSLGVSMRSSWDENDLGEWSDTVYTSPADLSAMINDNDRFVQYCIVMESESNDTTPSMEQIQISWNPMSINGDDIQLNDLLISAGNPSGADLAVCCLLTEAQPAKLSLFDLSGRAIYTTGDIPMNKGQNEFVVQDLSDGLYFARLDLEHESINARVTVLH